MMPATTRLSRAASHGKQAARVGLADMNSRVHFFSHQGTHALEQKVSIKNSRLASLSDFVVVDDLIPSLLSNR
jgi:hypothetical protein